MERENLFIVLTVILMMVIVVYEAMTSNRGHILFGSSYQGSGDNPVENLIDGLQLPPLIEFKQALKQALRRAIRETSEAIIRKEPESRTEAMNLNRDFDRYYDKAFSRFIFVKNTFGQVTDNLIPTDFPVDMEDLEYYFRTYDLSDHARLIKNYKLPQWPRFNSVGPKVSAHKEGQFMFNDITRDRLPITDIQYSRLKEIYIGSPDLFDNMAYTTLYVYHNLGALGNNGSIPRGLIDSDFIELFGSPLNTQQRYCSPFKFEQRFYGSLGSFFDYRLIKNQKYTCNPPYVDSLMTESARQVTKQMNELGPGSNISMLVVIPIWDAIGMSEIGDPKKLDDPNKDEPYLSKDIIEASGLVRSKKMLHKNDHKYYSWYGDKFVSYAHTYLYILSTEIMPSIDLDALVIKWDTIVHDTESQRQEH